MTTLQRPRSLIRNLFHSGIVTDLFGCGVFRKGVWPTCSAEVISLRACDRPVRLRCFPIGQAIDWAEVFSYRVKRPDGRVRVACL